MEWLSNLFSNGGQVQGDYGPGEAPQQQAGLLSAFNPGDDPRKQAGLLAFANALIQAGAPRPGGASKGAWIGGLGSAMGEMTKGQLAYDQQQQANEFKKLQMEYQKAQTQKLQGDVNGTTPYILPPGAVRMQGDKVIGEAPFKPLPEPKPQMSALERAIENREKHPIGSPLRLLFDDEIRKLNFIAQDKGTTIINPPAPTVTEVVDPTNPSQMIRINARGGEYKGGGVGSPGVYGVSGREPKAALREDDKSVGTKQVSDIAADLRASYTSLSDNAGITDPKNSAPANAAAWIASSPVGQLAGRIAGTENQSQRNNILMARPMLTAAVSKALGMNSRQMDSNAELKMWLMVATDPTLDAEANEKALKRIEQFIATKPAPRNNEATGQITKGIDTVSEARKVWGAYEPDKYQYRINNGVLQRKPK